MTGLLDLADRCEKATGPSWGIDEGIATALGWYCRKETGLGMNGRTPGRTVWRRPDHVKAPLPKFSKSLDAAMTLVPEGWRMCRYSWPNSDGPHLVTLITEGRVDGGQAATFQLALCAAALRARAQP